MRLVSLSSGSSGNCIYIGSESHHILVDTGIPRKRVEEGLAALDLLPSDLNGILITHEHTDHTIGLGVLARKYEVPVYGTPGTLRMVRQTRALGEFPDGLFHEIQAEQNFALGDLEIYPFSVAHDAAEPVAYRVRCGEKAVGVVTDLGEYTEDTVAALQNLDAILLEANHDVRMLQAGPYPYYLKQRVLGRRGHLSNENAGRLLGAVLHGGMKSILLGHLSKENNYAELAYETVRMEITMGEGGFCGDDFSIAVAPRTGSSDIIYV